MADDKQAGDKGAAFEAVTGSFIGKRPEKIEDLGPNPDEKEEKPVVDETSQVERGEESEIQRELMYLCAVGKLASEKSDYRTTDVDESDLPDDIDAANKIIARLQREEREKKENELISKIESLLGKGATLNWADSQGFTPLHLLAMLGYTTKALKFCVEKGAKKEVRAIEGGTALFWAVSCRQDETTKTLIELGCNVNTKNEKKQSALEIAAYQRLHAPTVQVLLDAGATVNEHFILKGIEIPKVPSTKNIESKMEIVKLLIESKPEWAFNVFNSDGDNAILHAARVWRAAFRTMWKVCHSKVKKLYPNQKTGESLVRHLVRPHEMFSDYDSAILEVQILNKDFVDVNEVDPKTGYTLLHEATWNAGLIDILLKRGCDPNVQDKNGQTPLHKAIAERATSNRAEQIRVLLSSSKLNVELENSDGKAGFDMLDDTPKDAEMKKLFEKMAPTSVVKIEADPTGIIHSGYLRKEGAALANWKKRWFELTSTELRYFEEKGKALKGTIHLDQVVDDVEYVPDKKELQVAKLKDIKASFSKEGNLNAPVPFCIKIPTNGRKYFVAALSEDDLKTWLQKLNAVLVQFKKDAAESMKKQEGASLDHPEFSGTWELDLKRSESIDQILKALGRSWIDRQLAAKASVTQILQQTGTQLVVKIVNAKVITKTDVFTFDGRDTARDSDAMAAGRVKINCVWSKDGKSIILTTLIEQVPQYNMPGTMTSVYSLLDPNTLQIAIDLKLADSTSFAVAKRVFKKK